MGRVFIFCFYFHRFKNITQTSSILLFWQTNNTIVFTLSTGRIVHRTICLERNYIKTDEDSVFTRNHAEFLLSFSIDQSFKRLSKFGSGGFFFRTAIKTSHRLKFWGGCVVWEPDFFFLALPTYLPIFFFCKNRGIFWPYFI
jgi:hypothetical protein